MIGSSSLPLPKERDNPDDIHVAVKEFIVEDMVDYNAETEIVKKYADMRYEINKLSMLEHEYVVKFVGLVTRPPSFVLEWAPLMSLEKIRQSHEKQRCSICPVSLYITMLQVHVCRLHPYPRPHVPMHKHSYPHSHVPMHIHSYLHILCIEKLS